MRGRALALPLLLGQLCLSSCYHFGAPAGHQRLAVVVRDERGIDLDAEAEVAGAVRRAIARGPGTTLISHGEVEATLEVRVLSAGSGLLPFSDPSARAAQYSVEVRLMATLRSASGQLLWQSSMIVGQAPYLSRPNGLEALDGARRMALHRAAEEAAEGLRASLVLGRAR